MIDQWNSAALVIELCVAVGVTVAAALALARLLAGPTLYDRVLAANSIAWKAGLVCATFAALFRRAEWIDAAMAMVFGAFVLNVALVKFFRAHSFQPPLDRDATARDVVR